MRTPLVRFALNFTVYLVFGGGILAFTAQGAPILIPFADIAIGALGVALWSGTLTTLIETRVVAIADPLRRSLTAGLLGGLSLGGFATILSSVAWRSVEPGFIAIGLVAGALMQAARAFSLGSRREHEPDAREQIASAALVLDVRNQDEWDAGHLPDARLVPADQIGARLADIEAWAHGKDQPIVVYCRSGARSGRARTALLAAGFTNVVNGGGYHGLK